MHKINEWVGRDTDIHIISMYTQAPSTRQLKIKSCGATEPGLRLQYLALSASQCVSSYFDLCRGILDRIDDIHYQVVDVLGK